MHIHTEKMTELGCVMPVPTKRPKTLWDELRDEFPCDPITQHHDWASCVKSMYKKDCGFDPDWNCDCDKCESNLAEEPIISS